MVTVGASVNILMVCQEKDYNSYLLLHFSYRKAAFIMVQLLLVGNPGASGSRSFTGLRLRAWLEL